MHTAAMDSLMMLSHRQAYLLFSQSKLYDLFFICGFLLNRIFCGLFRNVFCGLLRIKSSAGCTAIKSSAGISAILRFLGFFAVFLAARIKNSVGCSDKTSVGCSVIKTFGFLTFLAVFFAGCSVIISFAGCSDKNFCRLLRQNFSGLFRNQNFCGNLRNFTLFRLLCSIFCGLFRNQNFSGLLRNQNFCGNLRNFTLFRLLCSIFCGLFRQSKLLWVALQSNQLRVAPQSKLLRVSP